ncbi:MAG: hypothetical protein RLZZ546_1140 [Bacteroidota bacterium]|jgi:uncharacterized membrane protein
MFNYKKSDYFLGSLITLILLCLFSLDIIQITIIIQVLIAIALIIILIRNHVEYIYEASIKPNYIKIPIFFIVNPIAILCLLVWGVIWIINNPIKKFNTWLNSEKEKKMKFKEFTKKETKK